MNRIFSAIMILFLAAGVFIYAQPKIEIVGGDTYDWKKVSPKDDPLKATIKIRNSGNQKLVISEVKPGCGCTTANLDKTELEPGDVASLPVTLRIGGAHNEITKTVRITSNDPVAKDKILFLKANIFHPIELLPNAYLTFGEMKVGTETTSTVKVKNNTNSDVTLSGYEVTPDIVTTNLKQKKILKPGEEYEVVARVKPVKQGYFNCTIKMKTSNPDVPELIITGYGQVKESPLFNQ